MSRPKGLLFLFVDREKAKGYIDFIIGKGAKKMSGKNISMTTLCYMERHEKYLMLHRVSKKKDLNRDKWIGVGGHFEFGESPEDCIIREIKEETGLDAEELKFRGIVTFVSDDDITEYMHLFTCEDFMGEITDCDEGKLEWVEKSKISELNLWEGDKIFLKELSEGKGFFSLKLIYTDGNLDNFVLNRY